MSCVSTIVISVFDNLLHNIYEDEVFRDRQEENLWIIYS